MPLLRSRLRTAALRVALAVGLSLLLALLGGLAGALYVAWLILVLEKDYGFYGLVLLYYPILTAGWTLAVALPLCLLCAALWSLRPRSHKPGDAPP